MKKCLFLVASILAFCTMIADAQWYARVGTGLTDRAESFIYEYQGSKTEQSSKSISPLTFFAGGGYELPIFSKFSLDFGLMYNFAHLTEMALFGSNMANKYRYQQLQMPISFNYKVMPSLQFRVGVIPTYFLQASAYSNQLGYWYNYKETTSADYNRLNLGFQFGGRAFFGASRRIFLDLSAHYNPFSLFSAKDPGYTKYNYTVNQLLVSVGYRF